MDDTPAINDGADASLRKTVSLLNQIEANTSSSFGASVDDLPQVSDGADASLRKTVRLLNKIEANTSSGTSNLGTKVGVQWTDRHTEGLGNPYLVGSIVYNSGRVYRCLVQNDSVTPVQGGNEYWQDLGEGFLLPNENPKIIGGSINTSGGLLGAGGSINTSNGGGSINLTGKGSIQFGDARQRTTLVGTAQTDLPNYNYVSQIIISGTSTPNLNGTYTATVVPNAPEEGGGLPTYSFSGPSNGFSLSWNENEEWFQLFDGEDRGFVSGDGINWTMFGQHISQLIIDGLLGDYAVGNGTYNYDDNYDGLVLGDRFLISGGELRDLESEDNLLLATNTNANYLGEWTVVNAGYPEVQSYNLYPDGTVSGSVTNTTAVPPASPISISLPNKNGTLLVGDQSNGGGSINTRGVHEGDGNYIEGGSINTSGSLGGAGGNIITAGGGDGNGGSINTSNSGGSINTYNDGGSINTTGGVNGVGGSINTSNGGGSINTSGGYESWFGDLPGGSINTSVGGGSINTKLGFIELGDNQDGKRTTLRHKADEDHQNLQIYLPDQSGTLVSDATIPKLVTDITKQFRFSGAYPNIPFIVRVSVISGSPQKTFYRDPVAAASNPFLPFKAEPVYEPGYTPLPHVDWQIVIGDGGGCALQEVYRSLGNGNTFDTFENVAGTPSRWVDDEIGNYWLFNYSDLYEPLSGAYSAGTYGSAELSTVNWRNAGDYADDNDRPGATCDVEYLRGPDSLQAQALSQGKGILQVGTQTYYRNPSTLQYSIISQPTTIRGTATTARTLYLPNKDGTIALISDFAEPVLSTFSLSRSGLPLDSSNQYPVALGLSNFATLTEGYPCALESIYILVTNRQGTGNIYSSSLLGGYFTVTPSSASGPSTIQFQIGTRPLTGSFYQLNVSNSASNNVSTGLPLFTSTTVPSVSFYPGNVLYSTLRNNVTSVTDTTIPLTSSPFDSGGLTYVKVGPEIMGLTGYASTVAGQVRANVLRGQLGTTAQTHTQGTQVVATAGPSATFTCYLNFRKLK